jgi:HlyD family secretion protein
VAILPDNDAQPKTGLRWTGVLAVLVSFALLGSAVALAHFTLINGAVIASGSVIVRGKPKSIQHLDGGVVEEILVKDGDLVKAGQPLMQFDETLLKANIGIYKTRYANALALRSRLEAEQLGHSKINFGATDSLVADVEQEKTRLGQKAIFESRIKVQLGRREQLKEKIKQFKNQISGTNVLIAAKEEQITYIDRELKSMQKLKKLKFARESQILAIQRSRADILGQVGEHQFELSRIANSIRDTELEMLQLVRQFREEALTALRDVNSTLEELAPQIISTQKQIDRIVVRAPVEGIIHEMQVVTLGGVVPPGGTILQIIPTGDGVEFDTRVEPAAIDQVYVGQRAKVMLSAFNQRTTPELKGQVQSISPDTVQDTQTGLTYYRARISVSDDELARLGELKIVPGMPVEAFIQTNERTISSYLMRPLSDQLNKAFREE